MRTEVIRVKHQETYTLDYFEWIYRRMIMVRSIDEDENHVYDTVRVVD